MNNILCIQSFVFIVSFLIMSGFCAQKNWHRMAQRTLVIGSFHFILTSHLNRLPPILMKLYWIELYDNRKLHFFLSCVHYFSSYSILKISKMLEIGRFLLCLKMYISRYISNILRVFMQSRISLVNGVNLVSLPPRKWTVTICMKKLFKQPGKFTRQFWCVNKPRKYTQTSVSVILL